MGLGNFAESSRGSGTSSKSGGQDETKERDETSEQGVIQQVEEDSSSSRHEEKMDTGAGEAFLPPVSSPASAQQASFTMGTNKGGGARAVFDDALDGLPSFGPEEDDEDWHFALPLGSLEDVDVGKTNRKPSQSGEENSGNQCDQEEEEREKEGSSGSTNTSHSSQEHTPDNSQDGGMNQTEETEDSQQGEKSDTAPVEDSAPPTLPNVNIKDEPIDEGYNAALLPQSSIRQIKEELEHQEEELRISSVYSVGGSNPFVSPTLPVAGPALPPTAFFIPGRGTLLQAVASLPIRPPAPVPASLPPLAPFPPRPPQPPVSGGVRCSGCSKVLLKGQTAFQRKGSTQLFCSTVCLTGHLPLAKIRSCYQCNSEISQAKDMVTFLAGDGNYISFCGQFCLSVFRHKRRNAEKIVDPRSEQKPEKPPQTSVDEPPERPACTICKVSNKLIEHEVTHQGRLHKLCSDACFQTWRKLRQLALNCCEGCGLYCNSNSCQTLMIERSQLNFCGPTCIGTYKQTSRKSIECAHCQKTVIVSSTIMERDQKGKVQLYCSSSCVGQSRPPRHTLLGAPFPCSLCKVSAVPQYHLAMVDGTIRNFCSYDCVSVYRKSGHPSHPDSTSKTSSPLRDPSSTDPPKPGPTAGSNSVPPIPQDYPSSVPYSGYHPSHSSVPPLVPPSSATSTPSTPGQTQARATPAQPPKPAEGGVSDASKLTCHQCSKQFNTKPVLFSHQGRMLMFCCKTCCEQYKTQRNILAQCQYCKQERVHFDTISYNKQDVAFCSEQCKLLFKQELMSRNKDQPWRPCSYCYSITQRTVHSHYGGKMEEFCRPQCMSQYTVFYYGMGRCDNCKKQSYMTEKLQCLGSVCNFCNLTCLLQYCYLHFETSQHSSSNGTGSAPQEPHAPTQPHHSSKMNPVIADVVSLANGSATQPNVSADASLTGALPSSNIDSKNLDHASTQTDAMRVPLSRRRQMKNKSVLCRPFTMDQEIMCQLPAPSTETAGGEDNVKVVMVPVPVPVFVPVPMNMYAQHTPVPLAVLVPVPVPLVVPSQTKDVKDAAVQSETLAVMGANLKDRPPSSSAQSSSYSENMNSGDETQKAEQSDPRFTERGTESTNLQPNAQQEGSKAGAEQPPSSPVMDLEADFPVESLGQRSSAPQRGVKRPREVFSIRKRGRRRTGSPDLGPAAPAPSKLNHLYGVKAWRSWVRQRSERPPESDAVRFNEDVLQCDSAELSSALSRFVKEVRRPNGDSYSPDGVFYLCLGIQQFLFMKGRIENIFTDPLYSQFSTEITGMLQLWKPKLLPNGAVVPSRVKESYLWECKQLGAYSPIVLLNTLLFFCTKHFHLTTLAQHQDLSFANLTRCSKSKVHCVRHHRASTVTPRKEETERLRRRQGDLEMLENVTNPLQCPVRLYEFYLSRCPQTAKERSNVFYLQPEEDVHTDSSYWYTSQPLEDSTLQSMLTRILAVRDVPQEQEAAQHQSTDA
ncbi:zinc finger MYM-type protein 4-like isoform X2 [Betta splendens]|nr:zinc finger MYM-type protein 4-like isoform X2 [Betta splendens]XP_040925090.1 zinc finger MYM-type protein 4-like isoform X2 [Betta splendens]